MGVKRLGTKTPHAGGVNSYPTPERSLSPVRATIRAMPSFATKYTSEQRDAIATAKADRGMTARRVVELAAAGELAPGLAPFQTTVRTVNDYARKLVRARQGTEASGLTDVPARDAVEALRRRLVAAADHELRRIERQQQRRNAAPVTGEEIRQIVRCVREIAAIPARDEPRPVAPGQKVPGAGGKTNGDRTRSGLAGSILAAHRTSTHTDTHIGSDRAGGENVSQPTKTETEHGESQTEHNEHSDAAAETPGEWMRARVAAQRGAPAPWSGDA